MSETIYYRKNRDVILNRARRYYHDSIETLKRKTRNNHCCLSGHERNKKKDNREEIDIIICLKEISKS